MIRGLPSSLAARIVAALILFTFIAFATLFAGLYLFGVRQPIAGVQSVVAKEARQLADLDRRDGQDALIAALEKRRVSPSAEKAFDALIGPDGRVISGNFPSFPALRKGDWARIEADLYRDGDEDDHDALTRDMMLDGGRRLLVGRDVEVFADRQELMVEAALWSAIAVLLFGLAGGLVISRISGRRLESVSRTAHAVMAGNLDVRVPVRGSGDDFDQLGLTLNSMLDRNQQLVESIGRVSDSIAHELRTPLARLRALLEQLDGADDEEARNRLIAASLDEAGRIESTFDALLRVARLQTGRHSLRRDPVDLAALLADAIQYYEPEAEAKGGRINTNLRACTVSGDRDLLFQLIANLIDNGVKFAPEGGQVDVLLEPADGEAVIRVRDNGPGVPAELRPRLPERFFRAPGADRLPGTGLGLTIASAIVDAHAGKLAFSGEPGAFEVQVRIPLGA